MTGLATRNGAWLLLFAAGCAKPNPPVELAAPSAHDFSAVSAVLELRCGSLDCHGGPARNLRIHGVYGLRLDGRDVTGGVDTTEAEIHATYQATVTVDPEVLSRVTVDRGAGASRWLVLSKASQREAHEGGARIAAGSPAERCILSWLAGEVDIEACAADSFGPTPRQGEAW